MKEDSSVGYTRSLMNYIPIELAPDGFFIGKFACVFYGI